MKEVKDNFSADPARYAAYRPGSPAELFDFLFARVQDFDAAWDCGTGNGQVASLLAEHFKQVYATDISAKQLLNARQKENIIYREERAEASSLADNSIDLITIAQAFHWFDFEAFYSEAKRVSKPGALLAIWTYNLIRVDGGVIDETINDFYFNTVGPYWDSERKYVDKGYKNIDIPFEELETPIFHMEYQWTLDQFLGYINTWSSVHHYRTRKQTEPVPLLRDGLSGYWAANETKAIDFPVFMRLFRIA
ncbi:MAG TPA: class I SAM-dependent methyltransferase [Flavipsychrobacter sp.]|nr:class I SAM-dependent methyltransferase [Flavipsychrobacter sp.]